MAKPNPNQFDVLGRPLEIGDCVTHNGSVYRITRFNPKSVAIIELGVKNIFNSGKGWEYSHILTKVPEEDVILWLLKNGK